MFDERLEIPVAEKQGEVALDAARGNQGVDGLAYRNAQGAQGPKILRRLDRHVPPAEIDNPKSGKELSGLIEIPLRAESLQHFGEYQVTDQQVFGSKQQIQPVALRCCNTVEAVELSR